MNRILTAVVGLMLAGDLAAQVIGMPPPQPDRKFGWAGPAEAARARRILRGAGEFPADYNAVIRAEDFAGRKVVLWTYTKFANGAKHWPTIKQEIGDCVSHGWSHGGLLALSVQYVLAGSAAELVKPFPPYVYGTSRYQIGGGRINGDGSLGSWAAQAVKKHGYLPERAANCPTYSGAVARQWGRSGPPKEFLTIGEKYLADVRLVKTFDEACSAIAQGYPVPVCSDVGYEKIVERNGRIEGVRQGSWPHCMCFIGFDARPGLEALYCWNSWGPDAHAPAESYARLDGAPPGGFWVLKRDAETMLREEDSFAVSFNGFSALPVWVRERERKGDEDDALRFTLRRRLFGDDRRDFLRRAFSEN